MNQPRDDILISQIIDGDATAGEWDELTALAGDDPAAWRRLADALRDHKAFARAVNAAVGLADTIELPRSDAATGPRPRSTPNLRFGAWSGWTGWAVAAVVTLAWVTGFVNLLHLGRGTRIDVRDQRTLGAVTCLMRNTEGASQRGVDILQFDSQPR